MSSIYNQNFQINGVISTNKTVWQNLEELALASGCFITFDNLQGKWAVVINEPGTAIRTINSRNIVGEITVAGAGLYDFYNEVQIEFPHKDLLDQRDAVFAAIDPQDAYPGESPNTLNVSFDIVNDPIQAAILGITQLKQSRVDTIIKFRTDWSQLGLKAGDLVDVVNTTYGFNPKTFRIIGIEEEDTDDGNIVLAFTCLAYDADVYDYTNISRALRTPTHGIITKSLNTSIATSEDQSYGSNLMRMLGMAVLSDLLNLILTKNPLTGKLTQTLTPKVNEGVLVNKATVTAPTTACSGQTITISVSYPCCVKSGSKIPYELTGIVADDVNVPLTGDITMGSGQTGQLQITLANTENKTMTINVGGTTGCNTNTVQLKTPGNAVSVTADNSQIVEGESIIFTVTTRNIADGQTVPYVISGAGSDRVSSPTTGNITINSNTGTVTINTTNGNNTGDEDITLTVSSSQYCCPGDDNSETVTIKGTFSDGGGAGGGSTGCEYVSVPIAWCGYYDASGLLIKLTATSNMNFKKVSSGGVLLPTAVSVTPGSGSSTITVTATERVDSATTSRGGIPVQVITSFNAATAGSKAITGTTSTVLGVI